MGAVNIRQTLTQEANEPAFGGEESKNRQPYPSWWTAPTRSRDNNRLEMLQGFPTISFWFLQHGQLGRFPQKNLDQFKPPPRALVETFGELIVLKQKWERHSSGKTKGDWKEAIGYAAADFWDDHWKVWEPYLVENVPNQVLFFGIPFSGHEDLYTKSSPFFKKPLVYYPGKYCLMVGLSLAILILDKFLNDSTTPFVYWDCTFLRTSSPILMERGSFQKNFFFDMLKQGNTSMITTTVSQPPLRFPTSVFRFADQNLSFSKFVEKYELRPLILFNQFLQQGGFKKNTNEELSLLFLRNFRPFYGLMFQKYNLALKSNSKDTIMFSDLDMNIHLLYNYSQQTLIATMDWMIWSLMCLHYDLTRTKYEKEYLDAKVPQDLYDIIITKPLQQIKQENKPTSNIPDGVKPGSAIPEGPEIGVMIPDEDIILNLDFPLPYPFQYNSTKIYLEQWRKKWSETATFRFLGIGESQWPPSPPPFPVDEESYDYKFLKLLRNYPVGRLRIPPMDWASFKRKNTKWEQAFQKQVEEYFDWIDHNVLAEENPNYITPGRQLKDSKGELIVGPDGKALLNQYPNYMIHDDGIGGPGVVRHLFSIGMVPVDQTAKFIFGDDWTDFLDDLGQQIWDRVKKALKDLWEGFKKLLPDIWPYLLAIGGGLVVFFGVETYASEKIKLLAQ